MENENIMHFVYGGEMEFNSTGHLKNFIRYLYGGKSGRHIINEYTHNNVCAEKLENPESFVFTENPQKMYYSFIERYKKELEEFTNFKNDMFYPIFLIEIGGKLVTNFLTYIDDEVNIQLQSGDGETIVECVSNEYKNGYDGFAEDLKKTLEKYDNLFIKYEECNKEEKMEIEKTIHIEAQKVVPKNIVLSISHDDQIEDHPTYHIHRLYRI